MRKNKYILLTLIISFSSAARADDNPVPLLKCPAVPEAYSKMITSLKVLQTQIKTNAGGNCDPVKAEVSSLEKLLGERRKQVTDLVEKSKKEPLNDSELQIVRDYVNDITTKVVSTADLLDRSNQCFDEDRQKFGFGDLATLTMDATALAKSVAGPWAAPISLGGQALAGIFQGLEKVVKNKRGFDFSKLDHRESFVQSLCSYYNYRQDMNALMFPARRAAELRKLEKTMLDNLRDMTSNCEECKGIVESVGREDNVQAARQARDTDSHYVRPLGTYTVQSLSALDWIRKESQRLRESTGDEFGIGRDLLSEKVADMDKFFYEKEMPEFLESQGGKSYELYWAFSRYVIGEGRSIVKSASYSVDTSQIQTWKINEVQLLEGVLGLRDPLDQKKQSSLVYRIDDFERKSFDLLDRTALALRVQESYCRFVQKAGYYNSALQNVCENGNAVTVRQNLEKQEAKSSAAVNPNQSTVPFDFHLILPPKPTVDEVGADWAESLNKFVVMLKADPNLFERR